VYWKEGKERGRMIDEKTKKLNWGGIQTELGNVRINKTKFLNADDYLIRMLYKYSY